MDKDRNWRRVAGFEPQDDPDSWNSYSTKIVTALTASGIPLDLDFGCTDMFTILHWPSVNPKYLKRFA